MGFENRLEVLEKGAPSAYLLLSCFLYISLHSHE